MKRLIVTISALLLIVIGAQAQESPIYKTCMASGLNASDCTLLEQADEQWNMLESAQFDLDLTGNYDSWYMDEPVHFAIVGSYWFDPEVRAQIGDPDSALYDRPLKALQDVANALNLQLTFRMDIPDYLASSASGSLDRLSMELALVDGIGYVDLTDLNQWSPDIPTGWFGTDIGPFLPILFSEVNPFENRPEQTETELSTLAADGMTIARLPDVTIDGETVAVFETTVNTEEMFGDSTYGQAYETTLYEAFIEQGNSPQDARRSTDSLVAIMQSMRISYIQMIGVESYNTYTTQVFMDMKTTSDFWALFTPNSEDMADTVEGFSFVITVEIRDHNATPPAEAPLGAEIIPFTEILPYFMGQQSS